MPLEYGQTQCTNNADLMMSDLGKSIKNYLFEELSYLDKGKKVFPSIIDKLSNEQPFTEEEKYVLQEIGNHPLPSLYVPLLKDHPDYIIYDGANYYINSQLILERQPKSDKDREISTRIKEIRDKEVHTFIKLSMEETKQAPQNIGDWLQMPLEKLLVFIEENYSQHPNYKTSFNWWLVDNGPANLQDILEFPLRFVHDFKNIGKKIFTDFLSVLIDVPELAVLKEKITNALEFIQGLKSTTPIGNKMEKGEQVAIDLSPYQDQIAKAKENPDTYSYKIIKQETPEEAIVTAKLLQEEIQSFINSREIRKALGEYLIKKGINTLKDLVQKTVRNIMSYKRLGNLGLSEVKGFLKKKGLSLNMDVSKYDSIVASK